MKSRKKRIENAIFSGLPNLTEDKIKALMQKEASKGADKLDPAYIETCMDLLDAKSDNKAHQTHKSIKSKKVLAVAAVIILLSVMVMTVSANFFNFNIPKTISDFIRGNAAVDMDFDNADTSADSYALADTKLFKELKANGITPVTLPEFLVSDDCEITDINYVEDDSSLAVEINLICGDFNGYANITQYICGYDFSGNKLVTDVKNGQVIRSNGMDVIVFEKNGDCIIVYKDGMTDYYIKLSCDLNNALELAKSIR